MVNRQYLLIDDKMTFGVLENMRKFFLVLLPLFLISCSTCKVAQSSAIKEIQFGHGGGVTQSVTRYTLKSNGCIYNGSKVLRKVRKDELATIYEKAASLNCEPFYSPSNTFSFIRIVKNDTTLEFCWNGIPPLCVMKLNTNLYNLLPK